jgi:hypothetical protein
MNYFEIYFYSQSFKKALDGKADPEFVNALNKKEVKPIFQELTNTLFNLWVLAEKNKGREPYNKNFKILSRTDFPDISDDLFSALNVMAVMREMLYVSNYEYDKDYKDPYFKLFDFKGIIESLNNLEMNPEVFYINKFHIVNIIDTYLLGKFLDYYLRVHAPTKDRRGYESVNEHYYKKVLIKALTYKAKKIDSASDSFLKTEAKLAENAFYKDKKELINILNSYAKEISLDEFKKDKIYSKCLIDFRGFRVDVLNEVSCYLITNEELADPGKLFSMTHRKRLLLYNLLRSIEIEKNLPSDQDTFSKQPVTSTSRFDEFKRNEVRKHFG